MNDAIIDTCRACGQKRRLTEEHIILQAIGGRLTAPLYCAPCNNATGDSIDGILARQLQYHSTMLGVRRARGEHRALSVTQVATGDEVLLRRGTATVARPEWRTWQEGESRFAEARGRSKEEVQQMLDGWLRKQRCRKVVRREVPMSDKPLGEAVFTMQVGGRPALRAIAKIAYGFLASRLPAAKLMGPEFEAVRRFVFDDEGRALAMFNFVHTTFLKDRCARPIHNIYVHFDSQHRNVVGLIQLFGTWRFSVLLAEGWSQLEPITDLGYAIEPVSGKRVPLPDVFRIPDIPSADAVLPQQAIDLVDREIQEGLQRLHQLVLGIEGSPAFERVP